MNKYILVIIVLFTSGCGVRNEYIVSETQSAVGKDINYSKIDLPDLALHFRLYNDIQTFKSKTVIVVPIEYDNNKIKHVAFYSSKGGDYDFDNEFRVLLALLPKDAGFEIDMNKVSLSIDGIEYFVSDIEGPVNYFPYFNFSFPENLNKKYQKKRVIEGYIFSMNQENQNRISLNDNVLLNDVGLWHCYEIIFNVPTPSPKQNVKLGISGLYKNNVKYILHPVKFKEGRFIDVGSVP